MVRPERRRHPREPPGDDKHQQVRIRAGRDAVVINQSRRGVLIATTMRLLPGRRCVVSWPLVTGNPSCGGTVARSTVGSVNAGSGVTYHVGLELDGDVP